jgi:methionine-S-sulfoxide reductase
MLKTTNNFARIILGGGCFWCLESVFLQIKGVVKVVSGYSGGEILSPTYKQICTGKTGHAEVIEVTFDQNLITLTEILEIFWCIHNPTTKNRQGNDIGSQYRSLVFYFNDEQKKIILESKQKLIDSKTYPEPIVTEIERLKEFFEAEEYHQNYFEKNPTSGYCQLTISPKLSKIRQKYFDKLK